MGPGKKERYWGKNPKNVLWNDKVKTSAERKDVLRVRYKLAKERYMDIYKEEKQKVERCIYQSKKELNEQF